MTRERADACHSCRTRELAGGARDDRLGWDDFIYALDLYERSALSQVSLLGAEPSLHGEVADLADYALERGFDVRLFTSAVMTQAQRDELARVWARHPNRRLDFVVDALPGSAEQEAFLALTGQRSELSLRLDRPAFDARAAMDLIDRHGLRRSLRLSLALPEAVPEGAPLAELPASFGAAAAALLGHAPLFRERGLVPVLDSGVPNCMFTDAQLGALVRLDARFNSTCCVLAEAGPSLELWPGLPLENAGSLYDYDRYEDVVSAYEAALAAQRKRPGILAACGPCDLRARKLCNGGCAGYQLSEVKGVEVHAGTGGRPLKVA